MRQPQLEDESVSRSSTTLVHAPNRAARTSGGGSYITPFDAIEPLIRRWRLVFLCPLALAIATAVVSLILPKQYTATATFTADGGTLSLPGGLAGLAGLAGSLGVGGLPKGGSPDFYADVLTSREILTSTLSTTFSDSTIGATAPLLDLLDVSGDTPAERTEEGIRELHERIGVSVDRRTDLIEMTVEMPSPDLSAAVANRIVALLNEFNLHRRQTQSGEQRRFVGDRLAEAQRELRAAEAASLQFLQNNRTYQNSPTLAFEAARRERELQLRQEIVLTLTRKFEEARIAEVQDTPVINVVDSAVAPVRKSAPRRTLMVLAALVLGFAGCVLTAFGLEYWNRAAAFNAADYERVKAAVATARRQLFRRSRSVA